jgi:hypothetical protein
MYRIVGWNIEGDYLEFSYWVNSLVEANEIKAYQEKLYGPSVEFSIEGASASYNLDNTCGY